MVPVEMAFDDPEVAGIRPEQEVGYGPDPWDQAQHEVDADIARHSRHLPFGHAEIARFPRHVGAEDRARGTSGERDQIEDHVEPDRAVYPGNDDQPLENPLQRLDACPDRFRVAAEAREGKSVLRWDRHQ